jgi:hypothetical protein
MAMVPTLGKEPVRFKGVDGEKHLAERCNMAIGFFMLIVETESLFG